MSVATGQTLFLIGASHHTAPLAVREHLALGPERLDRLRTHLSNGSAISEALILATCNRTEIYGVGNPVQALEGVISFFVREGTMARGVVESAFTRSEGEAVVRHLLAVCSGIDSQIVGETEILGQVKEAYRSAADAGMIGPVLHRVFQRAFQAAKWVRSHTGIGIGQVSIGNVAVDLALRIFGDLRKIDILCVGSGEVGRGVSKALRTRGATRLWVTSRRMENAERIAADVDAKALAFETWREELSRFDIVIFSTAAPLPIVTRKQVESAVHARRGRPIFLVDVAVPRDVEPGVEECTDVFLYNMDHLAAIANENLALREVEVDRVRVFVKERAGRIRAEIASLIAAKA